jgi:hypothetical protein
MMNQLKHIMTQDEKEAVKDLITAHLGEQVAWLNLTEAIEDKKKIAHKLTELFFREDGKDNCIGTIPESFVACFGADLYLINIDVDGEHGHTVRLISGILE